MDPEFAKRLKTLVNEQADGVYSRFGKLVGVSATSMQRYLEGRALPGFDVIRRTCLACGVTPNWLLFGWEPKYGRDRVRPDDDVRLIEWADIGELTASDFVTVPILLGRAWIDHGPALGAAAAKDMRGFTLAPARLGGRLRGVRVEDEAMAPEVATGDVLLVDISRRNPLMLDGRLVLAELAGGVGVRRLLKGALFSNNPRRYPPELLTSQTVLGAITQMQRDNIGRS